MTWEERAREALSHYAADVLGDLLVRIRPIVEEEIAKAAHTHAMSDEGTSYCPVAEEAMHKAKEAEARITLGTRSNLDEASRNELVEQRNQAEQRAEQAEAHADALIAAITVRGSWPAVREVFDAARQWKAERD